MKNLMYVCNECAKKRKELIQKYLKDNIEMLNTTRNLWFKVYLSDVGAGEYAWVKVLLLLDDRFSGTIDNKLVHCETYKYGDRITMSMEEVNDILVDDIIISRMFNVSCSDHN